MVFTWTRSYIVISLRIKFDRLRIEDWPGKEKAINLFSVARHWFPNTIQSIDGYGLSSVRVLPHQGSIRHFKRSVINKTTKYAISKARWSPFSWIDIDVLREFNLSLIDCTLHRQIHDWTGSSLICAVSFDRKMALKQYYFRSQNNS